MLARAIRFMGMADVTRCPHALPYPETGGWTLTPGGLQNPPGSILSGHHCVDPACLSGCPVLVYDKYPATGIVRHLDDQCIGCQYCVMKCPCEVPRYSARRGIVRKCDMCGNRLSQGEAPACVQACPSASPWWISKRFRISSPNKRREGHLTPVFWLALGLQARTKGHI
jgi:ferredoxin